MTDNGQDLTEPLRAARAALLAGDYATLGAITEEIAARLAAPLPQDAAALAQIRSLAEENMALTEAAKRGVAAARGHDPDAPFSTYNNRGERAARPDGLPLKPLRL